MPANHNEIEKRLWDAADELRANSKLKSSEYSVPVLGLIFLRYADHRFKITWACFEASRRRSRFTAPARVEASQKGDTPVQDKSVLAEHLWAAIGATA